MWISIHALREEGDGQGANYWSVGATFLSTPSARRATQIFSSVALPVSFLSTPSARRATSTVMGWRLTGAYFYPRPPRGGRRRHSSRAPFKPEISIHALREEGDALWRHCPQAQPISIHALREEGDASYNRVTYTRSDFYPRPPRGGRPFPHRRQDRDGQISIHALREEGDHGARLGAFCRSRNFYPRPPRGGRPAT